jgi:hypothetical protein
MTTTERTLRFHFEDIKIERHVEQGIAESYGACLFFRFSKDVFHLWSQSFVITTQKFFSLRLDVRHWFCMRIEL